VENRDPRDFPTTLPGAAIAAAAATAAATATCRCVAVRRPLRPRASGARADPLSARGRHMAVARHEREGEGFSVLSVRSLCVHERFYSTDTVYCLLVLHASERNDASLARDRRPFFVTFIGCSQVRLGNERLLKEWVSVLTSYWFTTSLAGFPISLRWLHRKLHWNIYGFTRQQRRCCDPRPRPPEQAHSTTPKAPFLSRFQRWRRQTNVRVSEKNGREICTRRAFTLDHLMF